MIKNKNEIKLYNLVFPVFFISLINSLVISGLILVNFIIDSIVLLICLKILYNKVDFKTYSKTIFSVVFFGFIGDIIASLYLILITCINSDYMRLHIPAMLFIISSVILSAVIIFWLNYFFSFRKTDFTKKQKLFVSFTIAVSIAPYTFFIPIQYALLM